MVQNPRTIVDVLAARSQSEDLAYVFLADGTSTSEERWTFADTARHADVWSHRLADAGVGPCDRVILALNPGLDYIAALFGIMALGAVPAPSFPPLRPRELERLGAIATDCAPRAIVIDAMFASRIEEIAAGTVVLYGATARVEGTATDRVRCHPDDLALIQYTSGSTGAPKGVCLTHANVVSNCAALDRSMGHDPGRVGLSWLPPYHDMGLMGTIILSLYHGWPLVLMSPLHFVQEPRRWLEAITDYKVTITVGPNFSLDLCAAVLEDDHDGIDLSSVRELYCGAEPINARTLARFEEAAAAVGFRDDALIPCYGMAEATLFLAGKARGTRHRSACDDGRDVVSCGVVDADHTVTIVDPATAQPVPQGATGEIWVAGPSVAVCYFRREELSKDTFGATLPADDRRYLRTGDLGFLWRGELFVTGRIKDLIIVDGRNIYPQDVESAAVRADPAVCRAVAFSVPGEQTEQLILVVEAHGDSPDASHSGALGDAIRARVTAEFAVRPDVQFWPRRAIPTTTSGKVRRQETRRMFLTDATQRCTA